MARLPDHLPGSAPPSMKRLPEGSSRGPLASISTQTTQAAVASSPSLQSGPVQQRTRNSRKTRHTRDTSVASASLESSDLANIDLSQLHVESDSSDSDYRATRCAVDGSGHSRSMSNPFPSFFSPKKKKSAQDGPYRGLGDSASSGNGEPSASRFNDGHRGGSGFLAPSGSLANLRPSFSTGPCITCGSLMRWAHGAIAFRCGICLTVNDLVPTDNLVGEIREAGIKPRATASSPISIEQTQFIISQCLRSYLEAVLQDVDVSKTGCPPVELLPSARGSNTRPLEASAVTPKSETQARPHTMPNQDRSLDIAVPSHTRSSVPPSIPINHSDAGPAKTQRLPCTTETHLKGKLPTAHALSNSLAYGQQSELGCSASLLPSAEVLKRELPPPSPGQKPIKNVGEEREAKKIFLPLEDYVISHIVSTDSLDKSFAVKPRPGQAPLAQKEPMYTTSEAKKHGKDMASLHSQYVLRSDTLRYNGQVHGQPSPSLHRRQDIDNKGRPHASTSHGATIRPIDVDWASVNEWYTIFLNAGVAWETIYNQLVDEGKCAPQPSFLLQEIESNILKGQQHAQRVLLKSIETVLKRPGRRIGEFGDFRFLIIALANPLLHATCKVFQGNYQHSEYDRMPPSSTSSNAHQGTGPASGQHSVIIKRILGLISNSSDAWHSQIIACFARFPETLFLQTKDLVGGFLAYRLVRFNEKKESKHIEVSDPLVPKVAEGASAASFHAALNEASRSAKSSKKLEEKKILHGDDWQIKAAVRVLKLLFTANNSPGAVPNISRARRDIADANNCGRARLRGQIVPTSDFYITLLDNCDLVSDFEGWEQQTAKFSFCQYPFLLSVWAKIQILEYEARRQMKIKARDAFFDSIMTRRNFDQHLILNVRRDCLVEDSLKGVSAAIGSGTDDIKKGLRIIFNGEEGIDAGGLRKEWFLLLVREVFNPDHGMFAYDEDSQYCYFNPASFETSDQFFLVGVVMGLAIYNSTILDVALPPFAFRKLLLAAPTPTTGVLAKSSRPSMNYTLADLAEYRPRLAKSLQQLLDYDGDVEATFCLDFTITTERFGHANIVPLCPGGDSRPVTNSNRGEYVSMYVRYLLDTSISRQFEPFKRGFFTVCGCNALGLFRPEEIELLIRGSDEPLDVASLRLAARYENWPSVDPSEKEPTIRWFWEVFYEASPENQRKLLIFITGSDRIPATGPASLSIRILYLGNDTGRFPTARTCFNILTLYRYASKDTLSTKLWGAVRGSQGFGLK